MSDKSYPTGGEFLLNETDPADVFTPEDFDETQRMISATVDDFVDKHIEPVREELESYVARRKDEGGGPRRDEAEIVPARPRRRPVPGQRRGAGCAGL